MTATQDATIADLQSAISALRLERDAARTENARLLTEQREALEHQAAIADVLRVINASPGDPAPVFDAMLEKAMRLCGVAFGILCTWDGEVRHTVAVRGRPPAMAEHATARETTLKPSPSVLRMLESKRSHQIADVMAIEGYRAGHPDSRAIVEPGGVRASLLVPLVKDGAAIGYFGFYRLEVRAFSDKEIALLESFAAQAVIAIENARLLRELRERTDELARRNSEFGERIEQQAATIDVLKVMSSTPDDTQPVFDQIVRRTQELCDAPSVALFQFDGELVHYRARALPDQVNLAADESVSYLKLFPMAPNPGSLTCRAILERRVIHVRNVETEPGLLPVVRDVLRRSGLVSQLTVPLLRDGAALGAITLNSPNPDGFSDSQIALLQTFAEQAVIAIGSVATFRALRERTAELALRQNELRVTFENMGDGVAMFDESQRLVAWNRKFQDMLDVPDEVIAQRQTFSEYIRYLADRGEYGTDGEVEEQVRRLLASAGQMRVLERVRPNGRVIEVRSNPVAGGGFVLIYADITERKRNEAAIVAARDAAEQASRMIEAAFRDLKIAQANLIQAEKMASLGQLTAGIAHEIKNPLNFVNNFAELSVELLEELKGVIAPFEAMLSASQRDEVDDVVTTLTSNLRKINEHGKRADGIVKAMLEHSRGESGERRTVDINALAEEALNLAYHGARAQDPRFNITLERDFGAGIAPIEVNPQDMTRVLLNLFSNGFYAATRRATGGEDVGFDPRLKVTTREADDAVEIRVRDNGTGIASEIRDKLFQPFFTTKPSGEGTGLGLSITWDIVTKAHGGTITVESEVGGFTEFIVTLPRGMFANAALAAPDRASVPVSDTSASGAISC